MIMAKSSQDLSSSKTRSGRGWATRVSNEDELPVSDEDANEQKKDVTDVSVSFSKPEADQSQSSKPKQETAAYSNPKTTKKLQARLRSAVLTAFTTKGYSVEQQVLGSRVVGTLFGNKRGHLHFALQKDPSSEPALLIELASPITGLIREMSSGLVRIALECDKDKDKNKKAGAVRLIEEPQWRTYCNGRKCGFANRRECGEKVRNVLKAVEPISMGAGMLPDASSESEGELIYMRAKFERVVGSRDSEAFYMMNPDKCGAPELCIYLLRV